MVKDCFSESRRRWVGGKLCGSGLCLREDEMTMGKCSRRLEIES